MAWKSLIVRIEIVDCGSITDQVASWVDAPKYIGFKAEIIW